MSKRGTLKPMDSWEKEIRDNATMYSVVLFQPRTSSRVYKSSNTLKSAIDCAKTALKEMTNIRSALIYAIDSSEHHALVGTINRPNFEFKESKLKTF